MSNKNKLFNKKTVKSIATFAAIAIVIQGIVMLLMTPAGLDIVYPYVLAAGSDKITTGDNDLGEYFSLHNDVEDAGLIILSIDPNVADSYKLASDYLSFLTKFTNISSVATYTSQMRVRNISVACIEGNYEKFASSCEIQKLSKTIPDQFFSFLEKIYSMNSRLSPDRKASVSGIKSQNDLKGIMSSLTTDLFVNPTAFSGEHLEILQAATPEQYVELFLKHETALRSILGNKFDVYYNTLDAVKNGTIEETFTLRSLEKYCPPGDGAVFALLPDHLCGEDSEFIRSAQNVYGKVVVTDVVYNDCVTVTDGEEAPLDEQRFPKLLDGIRIANAAKLEGFRDYYKKVSDSFDSELLGDRMNAIGDTGRKTFFIISGSDAVTFGAKNKTETDTVGTVLEAPGQ